MRPRTAFLVALGLALLCVPAWASQHDGALGDPVVGGGGAPASALVEGEQPAPGSAPAPASEARDQGLPAVDHAWVERVAASTGIPAVALTAYARASLMVPAQCHLGWTTLAGIGWVESQHGTADDRTLDAGGRASPSIVGPALDGAGPVAAIPAPARSQRWHGDPTWDHAVGPMQFISASWVRWSSDGDGDGVGDPHDVDDAAYAAARYLCSGSADLGTGEGWARAVHSYNHAQVYVDAVHLAASAYASRSS